jgi:hypothetical protein
MVKFPAKNRTPSRPCLGALAAAGLLALAFGGNAAAHPIPLDDSAAGTETAPDFRHARHIAVSGLRRGVDAGANPENAQACRSFRMSERQVKLFFRQARAITTTEFDHASDWAPCHVNGKATIDGLAFRWTVSASGIAKAWRRPAETHDLILACEDDCHRKVFGKQR